jgi:VWFA-related protein
MKTLLLILLLAVPALGQTPKPAQDDDDVIRIKTNLVQLDAVVVDSKGHQVRDLVASDFEILEDGKKRTAEYFSYVSLGGTTAGTPPDGPQTAKPIGRVFVFVVSNPIIELAYSSAGRGGTFSGSINTQARAVRAADSTKSLLTWFVDTEMSDSDLVAIADLDVNIGVLSSFTNDRDVLRAAIDQVRDNAVNGKSPVIRVMAVGRELMLQSLVKQNLRMMETLENVVGQVESLPGRKVVTLVARGMLYNPSLPYSDVIKVRLARLVERANRAQIAIYTVQARDLSPSGGNNGDDGLIALAKATGGRAIYNTNDLRSGFNEIVEENRGYYLLGYNPGSDTDVRPRQLQVRVTRPGLKVLTRSQAFARKATQQRHLLDSPVASRDLQMSLTPTITNGNGKRLVQSFWRIDLDQVETKTDKSREEFSLDLFVRITGPDGRLLKRTEQNTNFTVSAADLEKTRREGFGSQFQFEATTAGYYRLDLAARDTFSGKVGRLTKFIRVEKNF